VQIRVFFRHGKTEKMLSLEEGKKIREKNGLHKSGKKGTARKMSKVFFTALTESNATMIATRESVLKH
jgi:hypothetical protein